MLLCRILTQDEEQSNPQLIQTCITSLLQLCQSIMAEKSAFAHVRPFISFSVTPILKAMLKSTFLIDQMKLQVCQNIEIIEGIHNSFSFLFFF